LATAWGGVPQGSVLGPVLFLIFINDLDNGLLCRILQFADDIKLFSLVNNPVEGELLQSDIDTVSNWAKRWQMVLVWCVISLSLTSPTDCKNVKTMDQALD